MLQNEDLRTLEQKIEDSHQKILLMDQHLLRVHNLRVSEEQEISNIQGIRSDLEAANAALSESQKEKEAKIAMLEGRENELLSAVADHILRLSSTTDAIAKAESDHEARKSALAAAEERVSASEKSISEREKAVTEREASAEENQRKIREFAESMVQPFNRN